MVVGKGVSREWATSKTLFTWLTCGAAGCKMSLYAHFECPRRTGMLLCQSAAICIHSVTTVVICTRVEVVINYYIISFMITIDEIRIREKWGIGYVSKRLSRRPFNIPYTSSISLLDVFHIHRWWVVTRKKEQAESVREEMSIERWRGRKQTFYLDVFTSSTKTCQVHVPMLSHN